MKGGKLTQLCATFQAEVEDGDALDPVLVDVAAVLLAVALRAPLVMLEALDPVPEPELEPEPDSP